MIKKNIGAYEVKTKFSEILRRVSAGEAFTVTNRGKPVADLLPCRTVIKEEVKEAVKSIARMKKTTVSDAEFKKFREQERK